MDISQSANLVKLDIKAKIDSFIKLNPTISNSVNIQNLWINLPNSSKVIPYLSELSEQENQTFYKDDAYFMRKDVIEPVMRMLYPEGEYKQIINALRSFIPAGDVASF